MKPPLQFTFMVLRLIAFTSLCIGGFTINAQNLDRPYLDSLVRALPKMKDDTAKGLVYQTLGRGYSAFDLSLAQHYGQELEKLSNKLKWENGLGIAYNIFAYVHLKSDRPDSAGYYYQKANDLYRRTKYYRGIAATHANLGNVAMYKAIYPEALKNYMEGLKQFEAINERPNIITLHMNIGLVFGNMKMYPQSKQYLLKALKLHSEDNNEPGKIDVLSNIGNIYVQEGLRLDSAKYYLNKSLELSKKLDAPEFIVSAGNNLADIYIKEGKLDAAWSILNSPIHNSPDLLPMEKSSVAKLKAEAILAKANPALSNANLREALSLLLFADSIAGVTEQNETKVETSKLLSFVYEQLGNPQKSLQYYKRYHLLNDSIDNTSSRQTVKNLEYQRELDLRDNKIALSALALSNQHRLQWIYVGIIVAAMIVGIVLFYQNRQRRKANRKLSKMNRELEEANKVKARFFSILSHDLRSPIANLSSYLSLMKAAPDLLDQNAQALHQNKIETAANNLLSTLEEILLWSKSQMENFEPQLKSIQVLQLFDDVKKLIPEELDTEIVFKNPGSLELTTDENFLKTIMRNLTANALKAIKNNPDGKVEWQAWEENGKKFLSITDNGPGLTAEQKDRLFSENAIVSTKSGLGLHIVRDLTRILDQHIEVMSEAGKGTKFVLNVG